MDIIFAGYRLLPTVCGISLNLIAQGRYKDGFGLLFELQVRNRSGGSGCAELRSHSGTRAAGGLAQRARCAAGKRLVENVRRTRRDVGHVCPRRMDRNLSHELRRKVGERTEDRKETNGEV